MCEQTHLAITKIAKPEWASKEASERADNQHIACQASCHSNLLSTFFHPQTNCSNAMRMREPDLKRIQQQQQQQREVWPKNAIDQWMCAHLLDRALASSTKLSQIGKCWCSKAQLIEFEEPHQNSLNEHLQEQSTPSRAPSINSESVIGENWQLVPDELVEVREITGWSSRLQENYRSF